MFLDPAGLELCFWAAGLLHSVGSGFRAADLQVVGALQPGQTTICCESCDHYLPRHGGLFVNAKSIIPFRLLGLSWLLELWTSETTGTYWHWCDYGDQWDFHTTRTVKTVAVTRTAWTCRNLGLWISGLLGLLGEFWLLDTFGLFRRLVV